MTAPTIHAADLYRHEELSYCDRIAEISAMQPRSLAWYASIIASRNVSISDLWTRVCEGADDRASTDNPAIDRARLFAYRARAWWRATPSSLKRRRATLATPLPADAVVLVSHWHKGSFTESGEYRDTFFAPLIQYLVERGIPVVILGHVLEPHPQLFERLSRYSGTTPILLSVEAFQQMGDLVGAVRDAFSATVEWPAEVSFRGRDILGVLQKQFELEKRNGQICGNLLMYRGLRRALAALQPARVIWPWEHHAWERLLVLAARDVSPQTRLVGYQHGCLPLSCLNHFPRPAEADCGPVPDRILTTGPVTRDILESVGEFADDRLQVGCALRYGHLHDRREPDFRPTADRPIGVGLLAMVRESCRLLDLALSAFGGTDRPLLVRCHPFCPKERILAAWGKAVPANVNFDTSPDVDGFLGEIGCLMCSESSLGFEAVTHGVHYIYADLGQGPSGDPMFCATHLKSSAATPEQLQAIVAEIDAYDAPRFRQEWRLAYEHVLDYFRPVDDAALGRFLSA